MLGMGQRLTSGKGVGAGGIKCAQVASVSSFWPKNLGHQT